MNPRHYRLFWCACVLSCIAPAESLPNAPEVPFVDLINQAKAAERSHSYDLAEQLFRKALARLPNRPELTAVTVWNELGYTHQQEARFDNATNDYHKALEINLALEKPDEVERATSTGNLGTIAITKGQFADAEHQLREALSGLDRNGMMNSHVYATLLSNLALVLRKQLQFDAAREAYLKAEDAVLRTSGQHSAEYARLLIGIAQLSYEIGNYPDAVEKDRRGLEIENAVQEPDAADLANVENNLGLALTAVGQLAEAESCLTTAIRLYKSEHLEHPPGLIKALNNLALARIKSGNLELAEQSAREAMASSLGADNRIVANLHNTLGIIAMHRQDRRTARAEFDSALSMLQKATGTNTPEYSAILTNLATLNDKSGDHERAEELYRTALDIDEADLGPQHPRVAADLANVATQLFHRKQLNEALRLYTRAKILQEQSLGPDSPQMAGIWRSIAIVQQASKHLNDASAAYAHAIAAFKASASADPGEFYVCLREYANLLRVLQQFDNAEETDLLATRIQVTNAIHAQGNGGSDRKSTLGFH